MYQSKTIRRQTNLQPLILLLAFALAGTSCKKYLDSKPFENIAVPSTLESLQALLDNQLQNNVSISFLEYAADNYYMTTTTWNNLNQDLQKTYTWDGDAKITIETGLWNNPYKAVYEANFVLDNLKNIPFTESQADEYNSIKGSALFHRSFMFYELAQLFCKPYSSTSKTDPGIVLRTTSEIQAEVFRSSVEQTYDTIITNLEEAIELLPEVSLFNTRPNKVAAYSLLARVYLSMRDYANAEANANAALALRSGLLDYNDLTPTNNPLLPENPLNNPEILYLSVNSFTVFGSYDAIVDSFLYESYDVNDLRKTVFFGTDANSRPIWRGSYGTAGSPPNIFDGLATDEIYLIRAECRARAGKTSEAMTDLNALLVKRWKTGTFSPLTATDADEALEIILVERRKELAFRGQRWSDLRRLNQEGANISPVRKINNQTYQLPANDLRWVFLIPEIEINRSGIEQNPR